MRILEVSYFFFLRKEEEEKVKEGDRGKGVRRERWTEMEERGGERRILNFSSREKSDALENAGAGRLGAGLAADPFSGGVLRGPQIKLASEGTAPGHRSCRKSIFAIWAPRAPRGCAEDSGVPTSPLPAGLPPLCNPLSPQDASWGGPPG